MEVPIAGKPGSRSRGRTSVFWRRRQSRLSSETRAVTSSTLDARPLTLRLATRSGGRTGGGVGRTLRGEGEGRVAWRAENGRWSRRYQPQHSVASESGQYITGTRSLVYIEAIERCGWGIVRRTGFSRYVKSRRRKHGRPYTKMGGDGSCRPNHISFGGTRRQCRGKWGAGSRGRVGSGPRVARWGAD